MRAALIFLLGLASAALVSEVVQAHLNADLMRALLVQAAADLAIILHSYCLDPSKRAQYYAL